MRSAESETTPDSVHHPNRDSGAVQCWCSAVQAKGDAPVGNLNWVFWDVTPGAGTGNRDRSREPIAILLDTLSGRVGAEDEDEGEEVEGDDGSPLPSLIPGEADGGPGKLGSSAAAAEALDGKPGSAPERDAMDENGRSTREAGADWHTVVHQYVVPRYLRYLREVSTYLP